MIINEQNSIDNFKLTHLEQIGKDYEESTKQILIDNGFGKYIVYSNPSGDREWKRARGKGVDSTLKIGKYRIDLEIKYNDANYPIRKTWLFESGISRFRNCPNSDQFNLHIILVNRPLNWITARELAIYSFVMVLDIYELINLLFDLESSTNNQLSSITNSQYNDYLFHYPINNNLSDKSLIQDMKNHNITCYQNSTKVSESIGKTSDSISKYQLSLPLTHFSAGG